VYIYTTFKEIILFVYFRYKATARMSCEAALTLALQRSECSPEGGVLTPAAALGNTYIERLRKTGMELTVDP